eukprot:gene2747-1995_t
MSDNSQAEARPAREARVEQLLQFILDDSEGGKSTKEKKGKDNQIVPVELGLSPEVIERLPKNVKEWKPVDAEMWLRDIFDGSSLLPQYIESFQRIGVRGIDLLAAKESEITEFGITMAVHVARVKACIDDLIRYQRYIEAEKVTDTNMRKVDQGYYDLDKAYREKCVNGTIYVPTKKMERWTDVDVFAFLSNPQHNNQLSAFIKPIANKKLNGKELLEAVSFIPETDVSAAKVIEKMDMPIVADARDFSRFRSIVLGEKSKLDVFHRRLKSENVEAMRRLIPKLDSSKLDPQIRNGRKPFDAQGSFGEVYFGKYEKRTVAIKQLKSRDSESQSEAPTTTKDGKIVPVQKEDIQSNLANHNLGLVAPNDVNRAAGVPATKSTDYKMSELLFEAYMLAQCSGAGVIQLLGFDDATSPNRLVTEFMASLSICDEMAKADANDERSIFHPNHERNRLEMANGIMNPVLYQIVRIGKDISSALARIHGLGIVHLDIAARNILLNARKQPKIADFGLAVFEKDMKVQFEHYRDRTKHIHASSVQDQERRLLIDIAMTEDLDEIAVRNYKMQNEKRPVAWSPSWVIQENPLLDSHADIYAFGCFLYEMLTHRPPHADLPTQEIIAKKARGDGNASIPVGDERFTDLLDHIEFDVEFPGLFSEQGILRSVLYAWLQQEYYKRNHDFIAAYMQCVRTDSSQAVHQMDTLVVCLDYLGNLAENEHGDLHDNEAWMDLSVVITRVLSTVLGIQIEDRFVSAATAAASPTAAAAPAAAIDKELVAPVVFSAFSTLSSLCRFREFFGDDRQDIHVFARNMALVIQECLTRFDDDAGIVEMVAATVHHILILTPVTLVHLCRDYPRAFHIQKGAIGLLAYILETGHEELNIERELIKQVSSKTQTRRTVFAGAAPVLVTKTVLQPVPLKMTAAARLAVVLRLDPQLLFVIEAMQTFKRDGHMALEFQSSQFDHITAASLQRYGSRILGIAARNNPTIQAHLLRSNFNELIFGAFQQFPGDIALIHAGCIALSSVCRKDAQHQRVLHQLQVSKHLITSFLFHSQMWQILDGVTCALVGLLEPPELFQLTISQQETAQFVEYLRQYGLKLPLSQYIRTTMRMHAMHSHVVAIALGLRVSYLRSLLPRDGQLGDDLGAALKSSKVLAAALFGEGKVSIVDNVNGWDDNIYYCLEAISRPVKNPVYLRYTLWLLLLLVSKTPDGAMMTEGEVTTDLSRSPEAIASQVAIKGGIEWAVEVMKHFPDHYTLQCLATVFLRWMEIHGRLFNRSTQRLQQLHALLLVNRDRHGTESFLSLDQEGHDPILMGSDLQKTFGLLAMHSDRLIRLVERHLQPTQQPGALTADGSTSPHGSAAASFLASSPQSPLVAAGSAAGVGGGLFAAAGAAAANGNLWDGICRPLAINIIAIEAQEDPATRRADTYYVFRVVWDTNKTWTVAKRFRAVFDFSAELEAAFDALPPFARREFARSNYILVPRTPAFLENRRAKLQQWIEDAMHVNAVCFYNPFLAFFDVPNQLKRLGETAGATGPVAPIRSIQHNACVEVPGALPVRCFAFDVVDNLLFVGAGKVLRGLGSVLSGKSLKGCVVVYALDARDGEVSLRRLHAEGFQHAVTALAWDATAHCLLVGLSHGVTMHYHVTVPTGELTYGGEVDCQRDAVVGLQTRYLTTAHPPPQPPVTQHLYVGASAGGACYPPVTQHLYVGASAGGACYVYNMLDATMLSQTMSMAQQTLSSLAFDLSTSLMFLGNQRGQILAFDTTKSPPVLRFTIDTPLPRRSTAEEANATARRPRPVRALTFVEETRLLYCAVLNEVYVYHFAPGHAAHVLFKTLPLQKECEIVSVTVADTGRLVVVTDSEGRVVVFAPPAATAPLTSPTGTAVAAGAATASTSGAAAATVASPLLASNLNPDDLLGTSASALLDWSAIVLRSNAVIRDWLRAKGIDTSQATSRMDLLTCMQRSLQPRLSAVAGSEATRALCSAVDFPLFLWRLQPPPTGPAGKPRPPATQPYAYSSFYCTGDARCLVFGTSDGLLHVVSLQQFVTPYFDVESEVLQMPPGLLSAAPNVLPASSSSPLTTSAAETLAPLQSPVES